MREGIHKVAEVAEHSAAIRLLMERFPDALTVRDAGQTKMLLVTDVDVKRAIPGDPTACAVVRCAEREGLGGLIGRKFAFLIQGTEVTRYQLGKDAQIRTGVFDDRGTMTTGPVLLGVPAPSERLANMQRRLNIHKVAARARRKPKSADGRRHKKEAEAMRQTIATYGFFRSWDCVKAVR